MIVLSLCLTIVLRFCIMSSVPPPLSPSVFVCRGCSTMVAFIRQFNPQEDRELHISRKEEHRQQIEHLWEKLSVSQKHREVRPAIRCARGHG